MLCGDVLGVENALLSTAAHTWAELSGAARAHVELLDAAHTGTGPLEVALEHIEAAMLEATLEHVGAGLLEVASGHTEAASHGARWCWATARTESPRPSTVAFSQVPHEWRE